jgi:phage baseplate assembly protein W
MAKFIGFSTINKFKKFTVTDYELVKRDLLNMLSIREGELPGVPEYGTRMWNFIFESMSPDVERQIAREMDRIVKYDPRIKLNDVIISTFENTVNLELVVVINPNINPEVINVRFDENTNKVTLR